MWTLSVPSVTAGPRRLWPTDKCSLSSRSEAGKTFRVPECFRAVVFLSDAEGYGLTSRS